MRWRATATSSLIPGTGVLTERVAIRPSTQGIFTSYRVVCVCKIGHAEHA